ncbi:hypothetical protein [Natrialba sp. PRR66]|uniref:hypothetical protein n=1 Tax=Natrialba sp. PRR66 TaxID=3098146 RepID=UPI002B1E3242|nr:hypothetical protein [Natrialba sp. PRR66]
MASNRSGRRAFVARAGPAVVGAVSAGCLGWGNNSTGDAETDAGTDESEPVVDVAETTTNDTDPDTWASVSTIRLDAFVGGWVGVEPAHIDRVENPTLVLLEGREYEFTCENQDNVKHNLAIYDAAEEVVNELATGVVADRGETASLTVEATAEMTTYICEHQPVIQRGEIEVIDPDR